MAKTRRNRRPPECGFAHRSRKEMAAYILGALEESYDRNAEEQYIFCADCDDSAADFSFDNLLKIYQEGEGGEESKDPVWVDHCKRHYAKEYCDWDTEEEPELNPLEEIDLDACEHGDYTLYEWANEDMQRLFGTNLRTEKPDDDAWNTLWDGTPVHVKFAYVDRGHADNTLALVEFEEYECTAADLGFRLKIDAEGLKPNYYDNRKGQAYSWGNLVERDYDPEETGPLPWRDLKRLYEYVRWFANFFEDKGPERKNSYVRELEYQAAWSFFANVCEGEEFPNPTAERNAAAHRAAQLAEFANQFITRGQRPVVPVTATRRSVGRPRPWMRRRVDELEEHAT